MRLLRPSAVAPPITVRNQVMWGLLTVTRLASCWSVPCHMCKKRWKNESWPESVPTFPNQVVAASGKPLWDVKYIAKVFQDIAGRNWVIDGDELAESGSGSWPLHWKGRTTARLIFSSAILHHPLKACSWVLTSLHQFWMPIKAEQK